MGPCIAKPLLGKYDATKLRPQLGMAVTRFKRESNKKTALIKNKSHDVAKLLNEHPPNEEIARRVTASIIKDENTVQAYEMLGLSCALLHERIGMISSSKKGCPIDLIEDVSTLIWSSTILDKDQFPELAEIRKQFRYKFKKDFEYDAERNTGGVVNPKVCMRLSVAPPSVDDVYSYMERIANEHKIEWRRPPPVPPPHPINVPVSPSPIIHRIDHDVPVPLPPPPSPVVHHQRLPKDIDEEDIYVPALRGVYYPSDTFVVEDGYEDEEEGIRRSGGNPRTHTIGPNGGYYPSDNAVVDDGYEDEEEYVGRGSVATTDYLTARLAVLMNGQIHATASHAHDELRAGLERLRR